MRAIALLSVTLIAFLLAACGPTPTPAPNPNVMQIELATEPTPLKIGDVKFIVNVKDASGKPVEGANVTVSYNMTTMSMGTSTGKATEEDGGRYTIKSSLNHGGEMKVTVQVDKPGLPQGIKEVKINVQ